MLPNEIKIGSRTVTVSVEPLGNLMGQYDPSTLSILIDSNLAPYQIVETFWHEVIHAINDYNRFTQELAQEMATTDNPQQDAWNFEERMTENFAMLFLQVITDNKLLAITV